MYRFPMIEKAKSIMRGVVDEAQLDADAYAVFSSDVGPYHRPVSGETQAVLLGLGSGLDVVAFLEGSPDLKVTVVERASDYVSGVLDRLREIFPGRVDNFETFDEFLQRHPDGQGGRNLFVKVRGGFAAEFLSRLHQIESRIVTLCGELRSAAMDPMDLYRRLRDQGVAFYLNFSDLGQRIFTSEAPAEVEVSVVVPVYNVGRFVDNCLERLALQTLRRLEVLVIDDGSPDDSGQRADDWASRFPGRIKVIHKKNAGCAAARMTGLEHATGEFVGFVDGDDWVDVHMYEDLYRSAVLHHADIAQCGFTLAFDHSGRREPVAEGFPALTRGGHPFLGVRPTIWRRIYRRSFLKKNGINFPAHIRRFDDLPFQFCALVHAGFVSSIPEHYYFYRQERPGQDIAVRDGRLYVHFEIFDWLDGQLQNSLTRKVEEQLVKVELSTHIWALSIIDEKFRAEYLSRASAQIFRGRRHLSWWKVARLCLKRPHDQRSWGRRLVLRGLLGGRVDVAGQTEVLGSVLSADAKNS
ncbi:glycosyltransferase [Ideonella livida]|uniref:Glycosyltransferase n=1 Tax=Ideonella livida TaxID=2707176 RepID=A0A7C9TMH4_9BURK|nr:glycosyltransferase [Ideonella livida]NDY92347.1 glycosyltransferase [Ideonella livida]